MNVRSTRILVCFLALVAFSAFAKVKANDPYPELSNMVGVPVTLEGELKLGKLGWLVVCPEGSFYLYSFEYSPETESIFSSLSAFKGRVIRVSGVLIHRPYYWGGPNSGSATQEHYMMDFKKIKFKLAESEKDRPKK